MEGNRYTRPRERGDHFARGGEHDVRRRTGLERFEYDGVGELANDKTSVLLSDENGCDSWCGS